MSEASKKAQHKYREKNKDKLNEYAVRAKEKYNNDDEYRNKKK